MNQLIGQPVDRVDGKLKVTGAAKYAAEFQIKNLAYAAAVQSTITKGRIENIDSKEAEASPGVLAVITYKNSMQLHQLAGGSDPGGGKLGEKDLLPLQSDRIFYDGQHIALVVADTFEHAQHAAKLVKITYKEEKPVFEIEQNISEGYKPKGGAQVQRGNIEEGLKNAAVKINETYTTPVYHHNPMEPQATIAQWDGDNLTIYDGTQSVNGSRNAIAGLLGIQPDKVRLICLYLGGGFGCKGFTWPHSVMAPMAAKHVGRPVKLVLDRMQMFTSNGHRSRTIQNIQLGTNGAGQLNAIKHATTVETSFVEEFIEQAGTASKLLYAGDNMEVSHTVVRLNKGTPCPTRAPGEAPGTYAFEVAMDELAEKLKIDPVELRIKNHADANPQDKKPWSSKYLLECYQKGAEAIGWSARKSAPGSLKEGRYLVGYGMATAIYPANRGAAACKVRMYSNGRVVAAIGTQDIGTGTYTILTQTAADALGMPMDMIEVKLGDTNLPKGPNSGGSQTAASAGPAVRAAALDLKDLIISKIIEDNKSPLKGYKTEDISTENGRVFLITDNTKGETYAQIMARLKVEYLEGSADLNVSTRESAEANPAAKQDQGKEGGEKKKENKYAKEDESVDRKKYSFQSFGAQFAKVLVDPDLGTVKVSKIAGVMDIGKVMNQKTAENQIMGGMIWGIGMALMEETIYDPQNGRVVTRDLADYHVPVNADMPEFHVEFLNKPDPVISPIGARGIGEIGITGITAAIANAIYNATGKRVRDLPITPDKLI